MTQTSSKKKKNSSSTTPKSETKIEKPTPVIKKRASIRFKPDTGKIALIDLSTAKDKFIPTITALIINESFTGCALLFVKLDSKSPKIEKNQIVTAQVGDLSPLRAEVAWEEQIDKNIFKIGLKYT